MRRQLLEINLLCVKLHQKLFMLKNASFFKQFICFMVAFLCSLIVILLANNIFIFYASLFFMAYFHTSIRIHRNVYIMNSITNMKFPSLSLEEDEQLSKKSFLIRVLSVSYLNQLFNFNDSILKDFFNNDDEIINDFTKNLQYIKNDSFLVKDMFNLTFQESISQSIKTEAGKDYETRIKNHLVLEGFKSDDIQEYKRSKKDNSLELDFLLKINDKKVGIGAKRTLRERYKQFSRLAQNSDMDLLISITLGTDLTEQKIINIIESGVILFISQERYKELKSTLTDNNIFNSLFSVENLTPKKIQELLKVNNK